jgi:hypothetical protein
MVMGAAIKAGKYLREAGYKCPTNPNDGFMQYAFQTKLSSFELFHSMPQVAKDFDAFMGNSMGARQTWVDWYPFQEHLLEGASTAEDATLLVDVGGGRGHDVIALHNKLSAPGKIILQDLPGVLENKYELPKGVEAVS